MHMLQIIFFFTGQDYFLFYYYSINLYIRLIYIDFIV